MKRCIILSRLNKTTREQEAVYGARDQLEGAGHEVTLDGELDWKGLRANHGGWNGGYRYVAGAYEALIFIEGSDEHGHFLAKGQTTIAEAALEKGTRCYVWRAGIFSRMVGVSVLPDGDWKGAYATAVLG